MARYNTSFLYGDPNAPDDGRDQLLSLLGGGGGVSQPMAAEPVRDRPTAPSLQEKDASNAGAPGSFRGFGLRDPNDQLVATMLGNERPGDGPRAGFDTKPVNTHVDMGGPTSRFRADGGGVGGGSEQDAELENAYRDAQLSSLRVLQQSNTGNYGFGEFARDNGAALLATALDLGFNKGRGLGGITAATAQEVARQAEARQKRGEAAGKIAVELRGKPMDPILVELQRQRIENARAAEEGRGNRFSTNVDRQDNPTSQHNLTREEMAARLKQAQLDTIHGQAPITAQDAAAQAAAEQAARLGTAHEYAPITAGDAARTAGAETGARIGTTLAYAPRTSEAAASQAAAVEEAKIPGQVELAEKMNPVLADRNNNGVGQGLSAEAIMRANPGIDFGDQQLLQQAMKTRTVNQKTLEDIKAANRGAEIVDRLHETAKEMHDLPKSGLSISEMNSKRAELERQYKGHAEEYAGVIGKVSGNNSLEAHRQALDLVPSIYNPYALEGIKGLWSPLEANINGNLGAIGGSAKKPRALGGEGSSSRAPAQNEATPSPGATAVDKPAGVVYDAGGYNRDAANQPPLPVTQGRPPRVPARPTAAPPASAGAPLPPGMVTIKLGNQTANVSYEQAQRLKKKNPELEIVQ